jgi:hypothetical protein
VRTFSSARLVFMALCALLRAECEICVWITTSTERGDSSSGTRPEEGGRHGVHAPGSLACATATLGVHDPSSIHLGSSMSAAAGSAATHGA